MSADLHRIDDGLYCYVMSPRSCCDAGQQYKLDKQMQPELVAAGTLQTS